MAAMLEGATSFDDLEQFADRVKWRPNNPCVVPHGLSKASTLQPPHGFVHREEAARPKAIAIPQPAIEPPQAAAPQFKAAEITCYSELIASLRERVGDLGVRHLDFDRLADFAEGLTGKCFGAAQVKRLGVDKLFDGLRAAGLRLRVEEDPEQTAKMKARIEQNFLPRQANQARPGNRSNISGKLIDEVLNHLASKKGGLTVLNAAVKQAYSSRAQRSAATRKLKRSAGEIVPENVSRISAPNPCGAEATAA
jgi:hypothetical protein